VRIGPELHQQPYHFRQAPHDGIVESGVFVVPGLGDVHELGTRPEDRAHAVEIIRTRGADQPSADHAIQVGLQLRPAVVPIAARQHQQGIVQLERGSVGVLVKAVHLRGGALLASKEGFQQLPGLTLELCEIRVVGQLSGGQ
jgi:hypothetical protein